MRDMDGFNPDDEMMSETDKIKLRYMGRRRPTPARVTRKAQVNGLTVFNPIALQAHA
jgi:hypothetical protein